MRRRFQPTSSSSPITNSATKENFQSALLGVEQTARGRGARTRWKLIRIGGGYVSYYIIERRRYSLRDG